jgi:voltage-gated potassium channel
VRLLITPSTTTYVRRRWLEPFAIVLPPLLTAHIVGIEHATIALQSGLIRLRPILGHHALIRVVFGAVSIMIVGAWVVTLSERHSGQSNIRDFGTALWWAIVTVTTVGYGDHFPVTVVGRLVATVIMMVGIGLIGTLTATVASIFVKDHTDEVVARATEHHVTLAAMLEEIKTRLGDVEHRLGATDSDVASLDQQADTTASDETIEE